MQKLKALYLEKREDLWELVRYIVAGGLTTLVSLVISYGLYFLLAVAGAPEMPDGGPAAALRWAADVINLATTAHVAFANVVSWIFAVVFAFWINRRMVFRVRYTDNRARLKAFFQFVSARVLSLLLFELGLAALLSVLGTPNILGRVAVLVLVVVFNYAASKFWIFKPKPPAEAPPEI